MKLNKPFFTICIVFSMCFFFSCGKKHTDVKANTVDEEMDSVENAMAEREARMMEKESWPFIAARDFSVDSIDIRIDDLRIPMLERDFDDRGYTLFVLSEEDFDVARELVKDYFQKISVDEESHSGRPFPYNYYFKQYVGYKNPDTGYDMIEVNMFTGEQTPHGWANELKNHWYVCRDGGKSFGHIIIDMGKKRVVALSLNGSV